MKSFYIILINILLIFCISPNGFAEPKVDPEIVQLEKQLSRAKTNQEKAEICNQLAIKYLKTKSSNCESYANQANKFASKTKDMDQVALSYNTLGQYYAKHKNWKKAAQSYESEFLTRKKIKEDRALATSAFYAGYYYSKRSDWKKTKKYFDECLSIATQYNMKDLIDKVNKTNYEIAKSSSEFSNAVTFMENSLKSESNQMQEENEKLLDINKENQLRIQEQDSTIRDVTSLNTKLESITEEQAMRIDNLNLIAENQKKDIELHKSYITILCIGVASVLLIVIILIFVSRERKKTNRKLKEQNIQIENQKEEIAKNLEIIRLKNIDITDSLNYAGKIQQSLLTNLDEYKQVFADYFIMYSPKDIVSGDFYWANKVDDYFIFTVGDCTGHSVPGAFMSMLGIALLNQIVVQQKTIIGSEILEKMRVLVKNYLGQNAENVETKDGMDMAICILNLKTYELNFSGAYNPMYIIRNKNLTMYNGEKCPVGIHTRELDFTNTFLSVQKGDRIYMFSDGYSDQFGGKNQDKFKSGRFKKLLLETCDLPMGRQKDKIEQNFLEWKGDFVQIDDVCVMGIEF